MSRTKREARKTTGAGKRKRENQDDGPAAKKPLPERPKQTAYDENLTRMDPSLLSDHLAKSLRKHFGDGTTIELEDQYITLHAIRDTTSFTEPHIAKHLPDFLRKFADSEENLSHGALSSPHTLVITASGIRAADLARELRTFQTDDVKIAKLFAKHMKMSESVEFVGKTKINIAAGTPSRPKELIEQNSLKLDNLKRIVIDGSYTDEKKRTIFDMKEVFLPLMDMLNLEKIKQRLGSEEDGIQVLVF